MPFGGRKAAWVNFEKFRRAILASAGAGDELYRTGYRYVTVDRSSEEPGSNLDEVPGADRISSLAGPETDSLPEPPLKPR